MGTVTSRPLAVYKQTDKKARERDTHFWVKLSRACYGFRAASLPPGVLSNILFALLKIISYTSLRRNLQL